MKKFDDLLKDYKPIDIDEKAIKNSYLYKQLTKPRVDFSFVYTIGTSFRKAFLENLAKKFGIMEDKDE